MKRDIKPPTIIDIDDDQPRQLVSKGDAYSLAVRAGMFIFLFILCSAFSAALGLRIPGIAAIIAVLFFLSLFWKESSVNILFWFNYILCKRIYGREGKPSRLTSEERWDIAWDTTIRLFEERR